MGVWLDHVTRATSDLTGAARALFDDHGLDTIDGMDLAALGLRSLYVPLGRSFIELLGVEDPDIASQDPQGRFLLDALVKGTTWIAWCLGTDDLDPILVRTGCTATSGFSACADGTEITWRFACTHVAMTKPELPFFLEWLHEDRFPGRRAPQHHVTSAEITSIEVGGDEGLLKRWVGESLPWVRSVEDRPGVRCVHIRTAKGDIELH